MDFPCTQKLDDDFDDTFVDDEEILENERKRVGTIVLLDASRQKIYSKEFPIYEGDNIIGRHENCDISIPGVALSKKHACIEATGSMAFVYDCGSSNKTRLKSMKLKPEVRYAVTDGDELCFANIKCVFKQFKEETTKKSSPLNIFGKVGETPATAKTGQLLVADTPASELSARKNNSHRIDDSADEYSEIVPDSQPCNEQSVVNNENTAAVIDESLMELNANDNGGSFLREPSQPELSQEPLNQSKTRKKLVIESDSDSTDIEDNDSEDCKQKPSSVQDPDHHYDSETDVEESSPVIDPYDEETDVEENQVELDSVSELPSASKPTAVCFEQKADAIPKADAEVVSDDTDIDDSINDSFSILETQAYFSKPKLNTVKHSETNASLADDSFAELETQAFVSPSRTNCVIGKSKDYKNAENERDLLSGQKDATSPVKSGLSADDSFAELETQAFVAKSAHSELNQSNISEVLADESLPTSETQEKQADTENQSTTLNDSAYDAETQPYDPNANTDETSVAENQNNLADLDSNDSDFEDSLLASMQTQKYSTTKISSNTKDEISVAVTTFHTDLDDHLPSSHEFFASPTDSPEDILPCEDTEPVETSQSISSVTNTEDLVETPDFVNSLENETDPTVPVIGESQSFEVSLKSRLCSTLEDTQPVNDRKVQQLKASQLQDTFGDTVPCQNDNTTLNLKSSKNEELNIGKNKDTEQNSVPAHTANELDENHALSINDKSATDVKLEKLVDGNYNSVDLISGLAATAAVVTETTDSKPDDTKSCESPEKTVLIPNANMKDATNHMAQSSHINEIASTKMSNNTTVANAENINTEEVQPCPVKDVGVLDNSTINDPGCSVENNDDTLTQVYSLESFDNSREDENTNLLVTNYPKISLTSDDSKVKELSAELKGGETKLPCIKNDGIVVEEKNATHEDDCETQVYSMPSLAANVHATFSDDDILQTQIYSESSLTNRETASVSGENAVQTDIGIGIATVDSNNNEMETLPVQPTRKSARTRKASRRLMENKTEPSPLSTRSKRKKKTVPVVSESDRKSNIENNKAQKSKPKKSAEASSSQKSITKTKKEKTSKTTQEIKQEVNAGRGECSYNPQTNFVKIEFPPVSIKTESPQKTVTPATSKQRPSRKRKKVLDESGTESGSSQPPVTAKKIKNESDDNDLARSASLSLRPRRSKPKIMFTGVVDKTGESIIRSLGGSLTDNMHECTHLVTDKIRRTIKFLCALVRGIHIVSPAWLRESDNNGRFVGEEEFQLHHDPNKASDDSPPVDLESQYNFNLSSSLCISRSRKEQLFSGLLIHVMKSVLPPPEQMHQILACGGAEVAKKLPRARDEEQWKKLVVIATEKDEKACATALKRGAAVVSNEFVLTGILRQELEVDKFRLFTDSGTALSSPSGQLDETKMATRGSSKATNSKKPAGKRKRKT